MCLSPYQILAIESSNLIINNPDSITIKVGVYENSPLSFQNENGEFDGIFPSLVKYIAQLEEWNIQFMFGNFNDLLNALNNSEIDLLGVVAYSDERAQFLSYNTENVFTNWGEVFTHQGSGIESFLDLEGRKIGVLDNDIHYIGGSGLKQLLESFDVNCTFHTYESYDKVFSALNQGEVDAGVINRLKGAEYVEYDNVEKTNLIFNPIENYFVAPKNGTYSALILSRIDDHLKSMKQDHASEYYQILSRFLNPNITRTVIPTWVIVLLIGIFGIAVIGIVFSFSLKNLVKKRTMELEKAHENYKQTEEKLRRSQKLEAIGLLAGGIAHDFNNILTVINGYSRMLLEMENLDSEVRESVNEILKAGEKASTLTKRLLTFSRTTFGELKVLDINQIILDLDKLLHRLISEDVELNLDLEQKPCYVLADSASIEQVLINLVANANDAVGPHGIIQIRTRMDDENTLKIIVEDNGIGMDPNTLDHLFEPFFTTKEVGKGTGLGLSTVYGIVKQLKGKIDVESQVGVGSKFIISLPLVKSISNPPEQNDKLFLKKANNSSKTILLVEDEESVQKITQKILEGAGFQIITAKNGTEALNLIKAGNIQIDLVLSDIIMPEMNGAELEQQCQKIKPNLKFLFFSGYPAKKVEESGIPFDPNRLLQKPYLPSDLLRKISELIS